MDFARRGGGTVYTRVSKTRGLKTLEGSNPSLGTKEFILSEVKELACLTGAETPSLSTKTNLMINYVIFDFGKVLGKFDKMIACNLLAESSKYSPQQIYDLVVASGLEKEMESGKITSQKFCKELLLLIRSNLTVPDVEKVWGDIFSPNPAIEPIVDGLIKKKVPICVLSNTNGIHWPYISQLSVMRKLTKYQVPMILSWQIKAYKPDHRMFENALESLKAKPEETLYLDDIHDYVEAARSLGLKAEQYDCIKEPEKISTIMTDHGLM